MAYPTSYDNLSETKADATNSATDHPGHHNALAAAINAVQAELGLTPSGSEATVAALLATLVTQATLDAHAADSTSVHGVTDTADLVTGTELTDAVDAGVEGANAYTDALPTTNVQTGTSYTPVSGDELNVIVEFTNSSLVTVTLPNAVFGNNAQVEFVALGVAGATFVAGSGATVTAAGGLVDLPQNCTVVARYRGSANWLLTGALV